MTDEAHATGTFHIPDTISPQFQQVLRQVAGAAGEMPEYPAPTDVAGYADHRARMEDLWKMISGYEAALEKFAPEITRRTLGGVPVIEVEPQNVKASNNIVLYTHGGAYVEASAESLLSVPLVVAHALGLRVISIDYTTAPASKWQQTTDEVLSVFKAIVTEGHPLENIAIFGDSSGGGLAAGSVLKMRDLGLGMPAAVALWSPWSDLTETGDSYVTLKAADPILNYEKNLSSPAAAYADPEDQKHPYVSPVYGDYSQGFPPTLIQGGTKEIFLSNVVRLYMAIDSAGPSVTLDLYEGMPHNFQFQSYDSPESQRAVRKTAAFMLRHLPKSPN